MTFARYAVYLAPPAASDLHRIASALLARDAATGAALPPLVPAGIEPGRWHSITEDARGYGFHATLKPPFRLAAAMTSAALDAAIAGFASTRPPFDAPPLVLRAISGFLALVPERPDPRINALADDCVRAFDRFRAPASATELARRRKAGLTPRQEQYLQDYGYPYVMEEFRLHFTLTARLPEAEREAVIAALMPHVGRFAAEPLRIDAIVLFVQPESGAPFTIARRFPFGG